MATSDLDFLLVEYEQKKRNAEYDLQKRKEKIYKKIPRLEEIDDKINKRLNHQQILIQYFIILFINIKFIHFFRL